MLQPGKDPGRDCVIGRRKTNRGKVSAAGRRDLQNGEVLEVQIAVCNEPGKQGPQQKDRAVCRPVGRNRAQGARNLLNRSFILFFCAQPPQGSEVFHGHTPCIGLVEPDVEAFDKKRRRQAARHGNKRMRRYVKPAGGSGRKASMLNRRKCLKPRSGRRLKNMGKCTFSSAVQLPCRRQRHRRLDLHPGQARRASLSVYPGHASFQRFIESGRGARINTDEQAVA